MESNLLIGVLEQVNIQDRFQFQVRREQRLRQLQVLVQRLQVQQVLAHKHQVRVLVQVQVVPVDTVIRMIGNGIQR